MKNVKVGSIVKVLLDGQMTTGRVLGMGYESAPDSFNLGNRGLITFDVDFGYTYPITVFRRDIEELVK
jgi:hypothetical protein